MLNKLGIIAGSGFLPSEIAKIYKKLGGDCYIVALENETDVTLLPENSYKIFKIGEAGAILSHFKDLQVKDIVIIGPINRPELKSIKVDVTGGLLLAKILANKFLGDNKILSIITNFIEDRGFKVISPKDILSEIDSDRQNINTNRYPSDSDLLDIEIGKKIIETLSIFDIGQSVIIEDGYVLGIEAAEGTDELIKRCSKLRKKSSGGVLVKMMKWNQDKRLDIPTIGDDTINNLADNSYNGLAISTNQMIILNPDKVLAIANKRGIFIKNME